MVRVVIMGAGSAFTPVLTKDIMLIDGLEAGTIALVDIDPRRLELSHKLVEMTAEKLGRGWSIEAYTDRRKALAGADYVISTIEVSGVETVRIDNDIPLKYGISQCIGDTIGPGGIFKALRTVPAWLEILKDVKELAPKALVLNYTNPMSIMTLCGLRSSGLQIVGLCHSVQGSSQTLAAFLDIPYEEMVWECAGINHNAWFVRLEHQGQDLYPVLLKKYEEDPKHFDDDLVRMEFTKHFGYYVTESSGHFSEYVPWFRKREDIRKLYCRWGYSGGDSFYADNWPEWRRGADEHRERVISGEKELEVDEKRSHEYASTIIAAHYHNQPAVIYGNVINHGCIPNLPPESCVEVPVVVRRNGFTPTRMLPLPEQCAAMNRAHITVHELVAQGILNNDKESVIRALMYDPLTAAVCSLAEIRAMFEEMWQAEIEFMPEGMK